MMHPNDIPQMEKELAKNGIPVSALCEKANIAQTTWGRWKNGTVQPQFRTWGSIITAYESMVPIETDAAQ